MAFKTDKIGEYAEIAAVVVAGGTLLYKVEFIANLLGKLPDLAGISLGAIVAGIAVLYVWKTYVRK